MLWLQFVVQTSTEGSHLQISASHVRTIIPNRVLGTTPSP